MVWTLIKTLIRSSNPASPNRNFSFSDSQISNHTAKWIQDTSKISPMEFINKILLIKVEGGTISCEEDNNRASEHQIEYVCMVIDYPTLCQLRGVLHDYEEDCDDHGY